MVRILIADDHTLLTDSLRMVLETDGDLEILGIAHNGLEAIEFCRSEKPDVVLMDIKMPVLGGFEAAKRIKEIDPEIKVIVLTSLEDGRYAADALLGGADAYILKDTPPERLKTIIECVRWGFYVMSGSARSLLKDDGFLQSLYDSDGNEAAVAIKDEDIEIIRAISEGRNNAEIAECFGYAGGTVKNKVTRLLEITGTGNRAQLVMFALKRNLL